MFYYLKMASFDLKSINSALNDSGTVLSGVDFSGKSLKLDTEKDGNFLYLLTYLPLYYKKYRFFVDFLTIIN